MKEGWEGGRRRGSKGGEEGTKEGKQEVRKERKYFGRREQQGKNLERKKKEERKGWRWKKGI